MCCTCHILYLYILYVNRNAKKIVFVVVLYAVRTAKIGMYAMRKLKMKQYAVRNGGRGFNLIKFILVNARPMVTYIIIS